MNKERLTLLLAAVASLKPEELTAKGLPKVGPLRAAVPDITKEEEADLFEYLAAKDEPAADEETPAATKTEMVTGEDVLRNLRAGGVVI